MAGQRSPGGRRPSTPDLLFLPRDPQHDRSRPKRIDDPDKPDDCQNAEDKSQSPRSLPGTSTDFTPSPKSAITSPRLISLLSGPTGIHHRPRRPHHPRTHVSSSPAPAGAIQPTFRFRLLFPGDHGSICEMAPQHPSRGGRSHPRVRGIQRHVGGR